MKKIYLAGRLDTAEGTLAELSNELESRGHEVLEKWFLAGRLPKPYLSHLGSSRPAAKAMIDAASQSDAFILFPTDEILGAAVEFGAALASTNINPDKQIMVIQPELVRQSVFYAHPAVIALNGIDDIRRAAWY